MLAFGGLAFCRRLWRSLERRWLVALSLLSCLVLTSHLFCHALALEALTERPGAPPYDVGVPRKTARVVLVVLDSLPIRIATDPRYMPRLSGMMKRWASGVLWASKQTSTQQGVLGLATGRSTSAFDQLRMFGSPSFSGFTIFDDLRARGETVCFNGEHTWTTVLGHLGTHNYESHGDAGSFFDEDMAALRNAESELRSSSPPSMTVLHITQTDFAAHQFGTLDRRYMETISRWDEILDGFAERVLDGRTTLIVTSDHGNDEGGSHGGGGDVYRRVPVVLMGHGIRPVQGFTMNIVDMPATIALLLGTRLPGAALAKPATAPLDLTDEERASALLGAYDHLASMAEESGVAGAEEHRRQAADLARLSRTGLHRAVAPDAEQAISLLLQTLGQKRSFDAREIVWVLLLLLPAIALALAASNRGSRGWDLACAALLSGCLAVEAALVVRFCFASQLKAQLAAIGTTGALWWACLAAVGAAAAVVPALRYRSGLLAAVQRHPLLATLLCFLASSALLPLSRVAVLILCLLAVQLARARATGRQAALVLLAFAAYLALSATVAFPRLGEDPVARYAYGLTAAAAGVFWLHRGPLHGAPPKSLGVLFLAMVLFPRSGLVLPVGAHAAAAVLSLALLGAAVVWRGGARPCLLAIAAAALAVAIPRVELFWCGLLVTAGVLAYLWGLAERGQAFWLSQGCALVSALCAMSQPADVPAIVAFFVVLIEVAGSRVERAGEDLQLGILATAAVFGRYAYFELFGRVDSPADVYTPGHVDVKVALAASTHFDMKIATALVLLKMLVASWVVLGALSRAPVFAKAPQRAAAWMAALMLLDVAQTALRMGVSVGTISERYETHLVTLFIKAVIYGSMVLGHATLRAFTAARSAPVFRGSPVHGAGAS